VSGEKQMALAGRVKLSEQVWWEKVGSGGMAGGAGSKWSTTEKGAE